LKNLQKVTSNDIHLALSSHFVFDLDFELFNSFFPFPFSSTFPLSSSGTFDNFRSSSSSRTAAREGGLPESDRRWNGEASSTMRGECWSRVGMGVWIGG